jgi:SAM-dependent methyltransferase
MNSKLHKNEENVIARFRQWRNRSNLAFDRVPHPVSQGWEVQPASLIVQFVVAAVAVSLSLAPAFAQHDHQAHDAKPGDSATIHHRFENAESWAKVFEDTARDAWQKPEYVVQSLQIPPDATIADIGSATGYFDVRFARAVPNGKVYGIDIEQDMVEYLNNRAKVEGLANLVSIVGEAGDPKIPEPVDLIFLCDTYHHIESRVEYFHNLQKYLKPGGRVVNVDFKPGELPVGPGPAHKLDPEQVIAELFAAGYHLQKIDESLPYQYVLTFTIQAPLELKSPGQPAGLK